MTAKEKGNWTVAILLGILLAAIILRLLGIYQSLPFAGYGDERNLVHRSIRFGSGDLNPHWFIYPTLYQYFLFFCYGLFFLGGWIAGVFQSTTDFMKLYITDPTAFFLIGRGVSAAVGTATVWLVYRFGRQAYDRQVGLLAAMVLVVSPLHVEYSQYALTDVPMTFLALLSLLFSLNVAREGKTADYLLAGLVAGLAAATKYPGGASVFALWAAHIWYIHVAKERKIAWIFNKKLTLAVIFAILGFIIACPYAILDFNTFWEHFGRWILHVKGEWVGAGGWLGFGGEHWPFKYPTALEHILRTLPQGMGAAIFFISLLGFFWGLYRRRDADIILMSFSLPYYLAMARGIPRERYMVPLIPIFALFGARLLWAAAGRMISKPRQLQVAGLAAVIILVPSVISSAQAIHLLRQKDYRIICKDWVEAHIPAGSSILLDEFACPLEAVPEQKKGKLKAELENLDPEDPLYEQRMTAYRFRYESSSAVKYRLFRINYINPNEVTAEKYDQITLEIKNLMNDYQEKYDYIIIDQGTAFNVIQNRKNLPPELAFIPVFYESVRKELTPIKIIKKTTARQDSNRPPESYPAFHIYETGELPEKLNKGENQ